MNRRSILAGIGALAALPLLPAAVAAEPPVAVVATQAAKAWRFYYFAPVDGVWKQVRRSVYQAAQEAGLERHMSSNEALGQQICDNLNAIIEKPKTQVIPIS